MTMPLKEQIAALTPAAAKPLSARELLHAVLDHADLECFYRDGRARVVLELPPELLDELILFEWELYALQRYNSPSNRMRA